MSDFNLANKETLVTGGAGFLGSHLVSILSKLGANVTVVDDLSSGSVRYISSTGAACVIGDIRDHEMLKKAMRGMEVVFNLAARPFVPYSYVNPIEVIQVNIIGSANVVLTAAEQKVKRFVHVSSSEVYGSNHHEGMREDSLTEPFSTYAVSKLAAERTAFTLSKEHDLPTTIVRPFNIYGPRDNHPRIIPTIIAQLAHGNTVKIGNQNPVRDLTYVEETARGIVELAMCDRALGQVTNLGSERGYSPRELVELISSVMSKKGVVVETEPSRLRSYDPDRMISDCTKARSLIGWAPKIAIRDGLAKTIDWYKSSGGWSWEKTVATAIQNRPAS